MRIAFHVPRASHLKPGFSGDKVLVRGLLDGLSRRGHDVQVVSRMNVRNVWRGRAKRDELASEMHRVRTAMERFAPDAWLVYGASTTNPDLFGWRMLTRHQSQPARYVLISTDLGSGKRLPPRWRRLFTWTHHRSLTRGDWISAYHPTSREDLIRHGVPQQRVHLFPPAVSLWKQIPSMQAARERLGMSPAAVVLFCASRFPRSDGRDSGKMQMLLDLIAASTSLPAEALVVIAGDGPGRGELEQAIAAAAPRCTVQLVGAIEHEMMPCYFAACDFFVYPNRTNRPWLAVLEAQACGRPVVTMRTQSSELTVCHGQSGLLASDLEDFRHTIRALAANRSRAAEMGRAAATYAIKLHAIDVRIDQIERLLEETNSQATTSPIPVRPSSH